MKQICLYIFFFSMYGHLIYGQASNLDFSNIKGLNNVEKSLPYFVYEKSELDTFLLNNQIMRPYEEEWGINVHVYASFFVDTSGKPQNIIISDVELELNKQTVLKKGTQLDSFRKYYSSEAARLIMLTDGLWVANESNCKNKLKLLISFKTEAFGKKNEASLRGDPMPVSVLDLMYPSNQGEIKSSKNIYKYYDFGVNKLNQNKFLIAEKYFLQALKVKKDDKDALYNLGICYIKLKNNEKACSSWNAAQSYGDSGVQDLINKYCK